MLTTDTHAERSLTLAEILSQPAIWQSSMEKLKGNKTFERTVASTRERKEWLFLGCGTSFYLAEAAAATWTILTGQRGRALPASELLLYRDLALQAASNLQVVLISRSGQTSEVLRAADLLARLDHISTLGITCASGSPLAEKCGEVICVPAADEGSTVMTRSFSTMLFVLQALAAYASSNHQFLTALESIPQRITPLLQPLAESIEEFVQANSFADYVFLGQGPFWGIAREATLKLTEMSCSFAQAYHTLEFRHGPKAIVDADVCHTFFLSDEGHSAETEVLAEVKHLGGVTVAICRRANSDVRRFSDFVFETQLDGLEPSLLAPFIIPAQLLGFFAGKKKGLNPDQPRHLSRVVTLD